MINCNPETVSTDNDTADKLYFEPVFWEHIYDIILHEKPKGVIVQLGGQTALKLAEKLERYDINIMGTSYKALDVAEDRGRFSELLEKNNIPFPKFAVAQTAEEAINISKDLNFPILVRPSYVLGGQGMKIVINEDELEHHIINLLKDIPGNRVLESQEIISVFNFLAISRLNDVLPQAVGPKITTNFLVEFILFFFRVKIVFFFIRKNYFRGFIWNFSYLKYAFFFNKILFNIY